MSRFFGCVERRTLATAAIGLACLSAGSGCDGIDQCHPGECEPCVDETCAQECEDPDDEDVGYICKLGCSDGADCSVSCSGGVSCELECDASECYADRVDVHCVEGATCNLDTADSDAFCSASTCDLRCSEYLYGGGAWCNQACTDGSACTLSCGLLTENEFRPSTEVECGVSCDESSSCHVTCGASCLLCCGGSTDCTMECFNGGGATCDGGMIVCGRPCPPADGSACPSLEYDPGLF